MWSGLSRAGSLVDWEDEGSSSGPNVVFYRTEQIINWRVERVNGRNVPTLIVLAEHVIAPPGPDDDGFVLQLVDQMRVLKLVPGEAADVAGKRDYHYQVELWQPRKRSGVALRLSGSWWE